MVLSREITARIREVLEKHPEGISITDLVKSVDVNRNTAGRYLENLLLSGQVEMRHFGMAKMYTLSKRLPASSVLSLSSELVMQLDFGQRVFYANDPLLSFIGVTAKDLFGKNIEFSQFAVVFEEIFPVLLDRIRRGLRGEEWRGELSRPVRERFFFCRIAPTVSAEGKKGVSILLEDISDRKRDEERIRQSEERLRSIFKASPVGIGVVSGRVFLEVNDRLCRMTGYSAAELIGRSARILYPSREEFERVGTLVYNQVQQGRTGPVEAQWQRKDGKTIDILLNSTSLDPANVSGGITFTALDITERNRAGRALRESEDRYRKLVEISPGAVILHRDGKIIYVNPAAVRLVRAKNADELLGKGILDFVEPLYRETVRASIARDISGETTPPMVLQVLRADGTPVVVEGRGASTSIDGKPAVLVAINDITERHRAELALRESEERYRTMFENTGTATAILEENTIVSLVNSEFERISGYTKQELEKKRSWTEFVVKRDLERILAWHYRRREGGDAPHQYEAGVIRKDGEVRCVLITAGLLPGTSRTVVSLTDITERKLMEEQLRQCDQQYRFIAENSLYIITRLSSDFICLYVSPAVTPLLGYSDMEMLGKSVLSLVHPDDLDLSWRTLETVVLGGSSQLTLTFRLQHRTGHYRRFESRVRIVRDEKTGRVREYLSISRDISARKPAGEDTSGD